MPQFGIDFRDLQVGRLRKNFTFEDEGTPLSMGVLPERAAISRAYVIVRTAFNSGTSDVVDIGHSGDDDEYLNGQDMTSQGLLEDRTTLDASPQLYSAAEREIFVIHTSAGAAPTAGVATAIVEFSCDYETG